jgi:hypothetical protein
MRDWRTRSSPPLPVPQTGFARGRLPPQSRPHAHTASVTISTTSNPWEAALPGARARGYAADKTSPWLNPSIAHRQFQGR